MHYDPVKDRLERAICALPFMRECLYLVLRNVFLREMVVRRALTRMQRSGFRPPRILDAGTGLGQYSLFLRQLFPDAEIVSGDIKRAYLENMRRHCELRGIGGIQFQEIDLVHMDREDEFDLILNVDVIEHIVDDQSVIENLLRALRPDGRLVLHTPAVPESLPDDAIELGEVEVGEHVRQGYKPTRLRQRMESAGYRLVDVESTYGTCGELARQMLVRIPMRALALSFLLAPLVALWMALFFLPARALNALDMRMRRNEGGSLLATARRPVPTLPTPPALQSAAPALDQPCHPRKAS